MGSYYVVKLVWALLIVAVMGWAVAASAALTNCAITGIVYNVDGTICANCTLQFNAQIQQTVSGTTVQPLLVATRTDGSGNIQSISLPQGLTVQITVSENGVTFSPYQAIIPFMSSVDFSSMNQGILLSSLNGLASTYPPTGPLSMNSQRITNLATDTTTGDALSRGQSSLNALTVPTATVPMNSQKFSSVACPASSGDVLVLNCANLPHGQQVFTSGGTFTVPTNVYWVKFEAWGPGGGGGGFGTAATNGGAGSNSTAVVGGGAGATTLRANGGAGGTGSTASTGAGGAGGSSSGSNGTLAYDGGYGMFGNTGPTGGGGYGGAAPLSGPPGVQTGASANVGSGGNGGGSAPNGGGGGGAGSYAENIVQTTPTTTFTVNVGTAGTAGTGGTANGNAGGPAMVVATW